MSTAGKLNASVSADLELLDQKFLAVYGELVQEAIDVAAQATQEVFQLSNGYLSQSANDLLKQFYALYFGVGEVAARKEKINQEVDDLFDQIQAQVDAGAAVDVQEDDSAKKERLGLSGLQKQMEGLITLDKGIREKILPAMCSMQFEDMVRQRLEHLVLMWQSNPKADDAEVLVAYCTSQTETETFYKHVLHRPAPAGEDNPSIFLSFMDEEA